LKINLYLSGSYSAVEVIQLLLRRELMKINQAVEVVQGVEVVRDKSHL